MGRQRLKDGRERGALGKKDDDRSENWWEVAEDG